MYNKQFIKERLKQGLMEVNRVKHAAGVLIKCVKTDRILLILRNDSRPTWALVSGGVDRNENSLEGLKREIYEELFIKPDSIKFKFIRRENFPAENRIFDYYEGFTPTEFKPILDSENLNWGWFSKNELPSPLYKGLDSKIKNI